MRKALRRIFLLCVALIVCMQGLCLAYVSEETWMEFWEGNWTRFDLEAAYPPYLDMDSVKAREYNGRKYLELMLVAQYYQDPFCRFHMLLDIEHQKEVRLGQWALVITNDKVADKRKYKYYSQDTSYYADIPKLQDWTMERERQLSSKDISAITEARSENWTRGIEKEAIQWVEQNRPDVIDEIRTFNHSGQPAGNTNVTGAAGEQGSSVADIVDNFTYEVLDSGAVKFSPRCMADDGNLPLYAPSYFIFAKPEKYSTLPGAYLIGWLTRWMDGSWDPDDDTTISTNGVTYMREEAFDYDPKTQTFTFYAWMNRHTPEYLIKYRMRFIDKNTVCIIYKSLVYHCNVNNTYRYMPYDKIPVAISSIYDTFITVENKDWTNATYYDKNKCVWCGDHFPIFLDGESNLNVVVDMARAFLAVNGKVGPIPDEYNVMTSVEWYD